MSVIVRMKTLLLSLVLSCSLTVLYAQSIHSYGGPEAEIPRTIVQLPDSGFIVHGSTRSFGPNNQNTYTLRVNSNGDTLWTHALGSGNDGGNGAYFDGQYYYEANSGPSFGPYACDIEKRDLNGNVVWAYGYTGPNLFVPVFMCDGGSGKILVMGSDNSANPPYTTIDAMLIDTAGNILWLRRYGGNKYDNASDAALCSDGGFIITGTTSSFNNASNNAPDAFLLRIDANGDTLWMKRYQTAPYIMGASSVVITPDGGFAWAGDTYAYGAGLQDLLLVRCDSMGDTLWTRVYGGYMQEYNEFLLQMPDSGFLMSTQSASFAPGNNWEIYLVRTDVNGDTLWTQTIGGLDHDVPRDMIHTMNGGVAILAQSASWNASGVYQEYDASIIAIDSTLTGPCFNGPTATQVTYAPFIVASCSPTVDTSGGMRAAHTPFGTHGANPTTWCNPLVVTSPVAETPLQVYPNPADDQLHLSAHCRYIVIRDMQGRIVLTAADTDVADVSELSAGIYAVTLDGTSTVKIVIAR